MPSARLSETLAWSLSALSVGIAVATPLAGWVVDGLCRDSRALRALGLPVFARGVAPTAFGARKPPVVQGPVRIGPDTWIAAKVSVLRNTLVGRGCVLGSHAVVKGTIPDYSIAVGAPARVVKNRMDDWASNAAERAELERALADIERKKAAAQGDRTEGDRTEGD